MYLKSLQIERFRAFRYTDVRFQYPGAAVAGTLKYPNVNLLLGNNGRAHSRFPGAVCKAKMDCEAGGG